MPKLHSPEMKLSEALYKNVFVHRKKHSLSLFDVALFGLLVYFSRTRIFIKLTTAQLAEEICEPYSKVAKSIKALSAINVVRKVAYKENKGIMISPEIINNGDDKTKAFRQILWESENLHLS